MSGATLVDWGAAERVASTFAGGVGPVGAAPAAGPNAYDLAAVRGYCDWAREAAGEHSQLGAPETVPDPELIGRREWSRNALATVGAAASALERNVEPPGGPLGGITRRVLGGALGAEIGLAVGWVARKVVGQYDVALFGDERPPRLLFVTENLDSVRAELRADRETFGRWIALHEVTHVTQFDRVDWLAPHLRGLAADLLQGAETRIDPGEIARRLATDPRARVREILRGQAAEVLATPQQRALLDRLQATMAVVEGHAEYVMDSAGDEIGPQLAELRTRLDQRRARRGGIGAVFGRLLGMEAKLRQYKLGKAFCDAIVDEGGPEALRLVWRSPDDLPTTAELERPAQWLERVSAAAPA